MKHRISCSEYSFGAIPVQADRIALVRALGFDLADIALFDHNDAFITDRSKVVDRIGGALEANRLSSPDLFYAPGSTFEEIAVNPTSKSEREKRRLGFLGAASIAAELGIEGVTLLPGIDWPNDPTGGWDSCVEELGWRVAEGRRVGVDVRVEPHVKSIVAMPEDAARLVADVTGLGLTLDLSHFDFQEVEIDRVLSLVKHTQHVHLRSSIPGSIQVKWTDNTASIDQLINELERNQYQGAICVEFMPSFKWNFDEVDVLSETLKAREWLLKRFQHP